LGEYRFLTGGVMVEEDYLDQAIEKVILSLPWSACCSGKQKRQWSLVGSPSLPLFTNAAGATMPTLFCILGMPSHRNESQTKSPKSPKIPDKFHLFVWYLPDK
jgi:hypothetical protein